MRAIPTSFVLALLAFPLSAQVQPPTPTPARAPITDTAGPAKRIWCSTPRDIQEVWFRRTLDFKQPGARPRLWFSCDNECTVFVNGKPVGTCIDHQQLCCAQLDQPLTGKTTIAVHAKNTGSCAAMSLWLLWDDAGGAHEMVTDENWRASTSEAEHWNEPAFDDSQWELATPNFDTTFGRNLYNGEPTAVHWFNAMTPLAEPIARGLDELRRAGDRDAARKALDAIERAVMEARTKLWQQPATPTKR